jgi:hypothetical protein
VRLVEDHTAPAGESFPAIGIAGFATVLVFVIPIGRSLFASEKSAHWAITDMARADGDDMPRVPSPQPAYSNEGPAHAAGIPRGLALHLVADDTPRTHVPNVRVSDFRARLDGFEGYQYQKEADWLSALPPGVSLVNAGRPGLLVLPTERLVRRDPVDLVRFSVGWLRVYQDKALSLPNSEGR